MTLHFRHTIPVLVFLCLLAFYMLSQRDSHLAKRPGGALFSDPTRRPVAIATIITSDAYLDAAMALRYSIRKRGTVARTIAAYVPKQLSNRSLCFLEAVGWELRPVPLIKAPDPGDGRKIADDRFKDLFSKLQLYKWTEYEHILLLDADTLLLRSIDDIWDLNVDLAAVGDVWMDRLDLGFNAGVLYFRPDMGTFKAMENSIYRDVDKYDITWSEQAFLNYFYRFKSVRLPYAYNCPLALKMHKDAWPVVRPEAVILHFTLQKPWNHPRPGPQGNWASEQFAEEFNEFWAVKDELDNDTRYNGFQCRDSRS
ncbi:glycosyltransferase family 8 protein [Gonapodya prolifera JEL478]|uniref:Glycosyltransferase family 8 protein n=1 Tax=Gonapodya prolifera (strain JEL478) TaxID=1344416 RepID=A0A139ARA5_GONPJ|nr:glycosyltransferase family 8 protein [Gonapodya prolifera JEL478]|eukprot:KXS19252.1 glycosyltransferase family 8 protein [Gonapodya prolifera JEL478]